MVVSRTLTIDSVMVPLVVSSMPKGMGRAIGKRIVGGNGCYSVHKFGIDNDIAHLGGGFSKNHLVMSLVLAFMMQTNIFAGATEVYLAYMNPGSLLMWPRRNSCLKPVLVLVNVQL